MTIVFHTRTDFDVVETPDAALFVPFVGKKPHSTEKPVKQIPILIKFIGFYVANPHWKLVD